MRLSPSIVLPRCYVKMESAGADCRELLLQSGALRSGKSIDYPAVADGIVFTACDHARKFIALYLHGSNLTFYLITMLAL